jgi:hypothetical protein
MVFLCNFILYLRCHHIIGGYKTHVFTPSLNIRFSHCLLIIGLPSYLTKMLDKSKWLKFKDLKQSGYVSTFPAILRGFVLIGSSQTKTKNLNIDFFFLRRHNNKGFARGSPRSVLLVLRRTRFKKK